jgi:type I restriction enzyme R subunit
LERVRNDGGLGIFVRSLVGLDREAAKHAFDQFQCKRKLSANQIEFLNMIIDYLTDRGVMDPRLLYESPFTDFDAMGVEGVFDNGGVFELISILEEVRQRAAA